MKVKVELVDLESVKKFTQIARGISSDVRLLIGTRFGVYVKMIFIRQLVNLW